MCKNLDRKTALFEEYGGRIFFTGESMLPVIKPGYRLKVEPKDCRDICIGDIVLFDKGRGFVCHRVVGKYKAGNRVYFLEKGDNAVNKMPGSIPAQEIIGRVTEIETLRGKVLCHENTLSKKNRLRLIFLGSILGACYDVKYLLFGKKRNSFTRMARSLFSRLLA